MSRQRLPVAKVTKEPERPERPTVGRTTVLMSWYAEGYGTASGERFDPARLACAAASRFRLRTYLHVVNPQTQKEATVWLNDRGAFEKWGRSIDCTPAVWKALGFPLSAGVVAVVVE